MLLAWSLSVPCSGAGLHAAPSCARLLGHRFATEFSSPSHFLLVFGWLPGWAAFSLKAWAAMRRSRYPEFAPLSVLAGTLVAWILLVLLTDESHHCAFGFGGMSCAGFWENFSSQTLFWGWIPAAASLPWLMFEILRKHVRLALSSERED